MAQMEHSNDLAKVWIGEAAPQHRRPESMAGTGRPKRRERLQPLGCCIASDGGSEPKPADAATCTNGCYCQRRCRV